MECADRIAVMTEDRALESVRLVAADGPLRAVTVRVVSARRRCDVTIRMVGARAAAGFGWHVIEVAEDGEPRPGGLRIERDAVSEDPAAGPEEAYWSAIESMARAGR